MSSVGALLIVVSHTTTRLVAPRPVTYALGTVTFSLAFIRNMRAGGISVPVRATTFSSSRTSAGFESFSGSKWLNSGSMSTGTTSTVHTITGSEPTQNHSHQLRGNLRISITS